MMSCLVQFICNCPAKMLKDNFTKIVILTLSQYLESTSLSGFKFLVKLRNEKVQQFFWFLILAANFAFSIYIILYAWSTFTSNPTITTLESQEYPIWNIPFPAIGICSINKLSRKAVREYVLEINNKMSNVSSEKALLENMLLLGSMYNIGSVDVDRAVAFQEVLDYYDGNKIDGLYNIKRVLEKLAPKCEDYILKCRWMGEENGCQKLFTLTATSDGFCCTFNYDRFKYKYTQSEFLKTNLTGSSNGLVVLLNGSTSDYFYSNRNTIGFVVQLFSPGNFPDGTTGNLREFILNPGREVFLKLVATTEKSTNSIKPYGIAQRKCLFTDERRADYGQHYSYPECLTKCKLRSIQALCNCIPFYVPFDLLDTESITYCTLAHARCLDRYRVTWNTYRPIGAGITGFEREQEDSLNCPDCLPLCSTTSYNFESTSSIIQANGFSRTRFGFLEEVNDLTNVSLLRIYYASTASVLYKTDVLFTWYEILANFGGLLGLCLGFSIISLVEILYFFTVRLFENRHEIISNQARSINRKRNRLYIPDILHIKKKRTRNAKPQLEYLE